VPRAAGGVPARRRVRDVPIPVTWSGSAVVILDQNRLPREERYLRCRTSAEVVSAIRTLSVRGAPLIGIAGAYGAALAAFGPGVVGARAALRNVERAGARLAVARPTAVNLAAAVGRVVRAARAVVAEEDDATAADVAAAALAVARRIDGEERDACRAIGALGAELVPAGARILTHCNTGRLATNGQGTAQAVITSSFDAGKVARVWVDETRPVLQGSRLTAWELQRLGVPMTLLADTAAASMMARGEVDLVVVGADRIAANGDVANKVGTYALAVLARYHRVPFYVAAPTSTVDPDMGSGSDIPIEDRGRREVAAPFGVEVAPRSTPVANPAFDVTPARLVSAIVTERGVARAPYRRGLAALLGRGPG
jgi:methylthioribose-1-phosphate isomerase